MQRKMPNVFPSRAEIHNDGRLKKKLATSSYAVPESEGKNLVILLKSELEILKGLAKGQHPSFRQGNARAAADEDRETRRKIAEERKANVQFGAWVEEMLAGAVRPVEPWTSAEGLEVTDGASFVEAHGDDDLTAALMVLYDCNTVSRATAKNFGSPRDSSPGSDDASPAARGDGPALTVAPVAPNASATPEAASAPPATSPSGSMTSADAPSSPSPVLSAV